MGGSYNPMGFNGDDGEVTMMNMVQYQDTMGGSNHPLGVDDGDGEDDDDDDNGDGGSDYDDNGGDDDYGAVPGHNERQ